MERDKELKISWVRRKVRKIMENDFQNLVHNAQINFNISKDSRWLDQKFLLSVFDYDKIGKLEEKIFELSIYISTKQIILLGHLCGCKRKMYEVAF